MLIRPLPLFALWFQTPQPSVTLLDYIPTREETALLKLGLKTGKKRYCPLPGIYNIYNVLASITAALLGLPISAIKQALSGFPGRRAIQQITSAMAANHW